MSSRDREFRPPRHRDFDDDNYSPPSRSFDPPPRSGGDRFAAPSGPPVQAVVKWFKPEKGFGFVSLADGAADAFLHASVLERSGIATVLPGTTLEVRVTAGQKGQQVAEVISVDNTTATAAPARQSSFRAGPRQAPGEATVQVSGTVKWFNAAKGFGFIARDDGGKDVFVHVSALERSGIAGLNEGQRVYVEAVEGAKGIEAAAVRLA